MKHARAKQGALVDVGGVAATGKNCHQNAGFTKQASEQGEHVSADSDTNRFARLGSTPALGC
jgi:hypothetical protein